LSTPGQSNPEQPHRLNNGGLIDRTRLLAFRFDETSYTGFAGDTLASALLAAGVKIYEWQGKMLHAKTATVDGVWSTVGTSNLDWWSIARDNELNAIILSHSFAQLMNLMFSDDIERCKPIKFEEWKRRGLNERLQESVAWMIEPLL